MNSLKPAALNFSFSGFCERGGRTGHHADGWGIAFHTAEGCRLFVEERAAAASPIAAALREAPIRARNIVAHVRKATQGAVARENCHPFVRRLWGRSWSFAHNGDLKGFVPVMRGPFAPFGNTDSERAFCYLLNHLHARWGVQPPDVQALHAALSEQVAVIARHGSFNFLLSDGLVMFAHATTRLYCVERAYPFQSACSRDTGSVVMLGHVNHLDDRMSVIATEALTDDESWLPLPSAELLLFHGGRLRDPSTFRQPASLLISS
ncbi:class II glutamine amidotransferase [Massilia sp. TS11]|nr:class II glutamine amidotransferase [Massilia sp. TS11]